MSKSQFFPRRFDSLFLCTCRPIYTGFFFKLWDNVFGTNYPGKCACYQCRPKRSIQEWLKIEKPDYSVLLSPAWWISSGY